MKIFIEKESKQLVLNKSLSGLDLLKELDINPNTVILIVNKEVILLEEKISKNSDVRILSVVSGG